MATLFFNERIGHLSDGDLVMIDPNFRDEGLESFLRGAMNEGIFPGKVYKVQWGEYQDGYYFCTLKSENGGTYILIPLIGRSCARYFKRYEASCFDKRRADRMCEPRKKSL